jgi:hypothetical protein
VFFRARRQPTLAESPRNGDTKRAPHDRKSVRWKAPLILALVIGAAPAAVAIANSGHTAKAGLREFRQSVNMLTLYALETTSVKCVYRTSSGRSS